jgi:hypothetical protein
MEHIDIVIKEPNTGYPDRPTIEHRMTIPAALLPNVGDEFIGAKAHKGTNFRALRILTKRVIITDTGKTVNYTATCIAEQ